MSKETFSDFATWFYRSVIGMALTVIFFFAKSNYEDFREMKMDIVNVKQEYAQFKEEKKRFEARVSVVEYCCGISKSNQ
jgi:cell division protein FtsB